MTSLTPVSFRKGRESAPRLSPLRVPGRHSARYWTAEEDAVIRRCYPAGGTGACLAELAKIGSPRRVTQVYNRANTLGVKFSGPAGGRKRRTVTSDPETLDATIRERWPSLSGRGAVNRLADELGVPRYTITNRAVRLGLTLPHKKEPPWTAAEVALMNKVPLHNPDRASAIFRQNGFSRTPTSIVVRAKRLGLSRRAKGTFTATAAAQVLGVDSKTFATWCIAGDVRATRRHTKRLPQQGGDMWDISPAELRSFVLDNLGRIDIRKVEKFAFVDLLVRDPSTGSAPATSASPGDRER